MFQSILPNVVFEKKCTFVSDFNNAPRGLDQFFRLHFSRRQGRPASPYGGYVVTFTVQLLNDKLKATYHYLAGGPVNVLNTFRTAAHTPQVNLTC